MRENRTSGSVRGALGNRRSYREISININNSTLALSVDSGGVANLIQQVSKQIVSGIDEVICFR